MKKMADILPLEDFEKGYFSAFLDCDGSLSMNKHKEGAQSLLGYVYVPAVSFFNTNQEILEKLKERLGGCCGSWRSNPRWNGKKQLGILILSSNIMRWLLPQLNLEIKAEQQKLLITALGIMEDNRKNEYGRHKHPKFYDNYRKLDEIYGRFKEINKFGKGKH